MGRADYFLQRDIGEEGRGLGDVWDKSLGQQAGINKYRGIGRGLGALGGILLAGSGAGIPLLALAGGLGSFAGSHAGKYLGQKKYGAPAQAGREGLFHLGAKEEQRESVGDYWKGMKEQIAVNTLQDAITAGMYGSKIHDIAGKFKDTAALGLDEAKFRLAGGYKGMAPTAPAPIQQANTAGLIPDYQQQQLGQYINQIKQGNASNLIPPDPIGKGVGSNIMSTTAAPARPYTQGISYSDVSGAEMLPDFDLTGLNIDAVKKDMARGTDQRIADVLDVAPSTLGVQTGFKQWADAKDATSLDLNAMDTSGNLNLTGSSDLLSQAVTNTGTYTGTYDQNINLFKDYPEMKDKSFPERKKFWESLFGDSQTSQQTSPPSQYDFWTTLPAGRGPTKVQQAYNPRLRQQLLEKSKYFEG